MNANAQRKENQIASFCDARDLRRRLCLSWLAAILLATNVTTIAATIDVNLGQMVFIPANVTIHPGDTVKWTWTTGHTSSVTSGVDGVPNGLFDSGVRVRPFTFSYTFESAGQFDYFCRVEPNVMVGVVEVVGSPTPTPTPGGTAGLVANVATRLPVGQDDNALFEGFIVQGPAGSSKKIMVRAIGPFLAAFGIPDSLANPTLDIFEGSNKVATNNDWRTTQIGGLITADQSAEIAASGLTPGNELESAIIANLAPGSYTALVRGLGNTVGIGLVDAYDLSASSPAKVANFSTRGLVQPGDKLLTAGFIIQSGSVRAVIRAVGPSLIAFGISNALPDTTLQLRDQNGNLVQENDDWETDQRQELLDSGLQPSNPKEAALVRTIQPGQYTAQVRGKPEAAGVGVVEVYFIQ